MIVEVKIDVVMGSWVPSEDVWKKINDSDEKKHSHKNYDVLNKITAVESEVKSDSDNPVSSSAVAGEIEKIHSHENKDVLDLIGQKDGNLIFDGKEITASGTDNYGTLDALIVAKLVRESNVNISSGKPSEALNDSSYTDPFYGLTANTYIIFVPTEDGELQCYSSDSYEFTDTIIVHAGDMVVWYYDMDGVLNRYLKQGKGILDLLINGLNSLS